MEVKDLERGELFELVDVLSARLGRSIKEECILTLRVRGLERALEAAMKDTRCKDDGQNEYVVKLLKAEEMASKWRAQAESLGTEAQGWREACEHAEGLMYETRRELAAAKAQWKEYTDHKENRIKALEEANSSLAETGKRHLTESQIYQNEAKRLERELKNCRATVMDEVSAMIPKAVNAERDACAEIARAEALRCAMPENTSLLMAIVNMIKARGGK